MPDFLETSDYLLAGLLSALSLALIFRKVDADGGAERLKFYASATVSSLAVGAAVLAMWYANDRPLGGFGLFGWLGDLNSTTVAATGWVAALLVALQLVKHGVLRAPLTSVYRKYAHLMPQNGKELGASWGTSLAAGAGEEIVYRGFLLWFLVSLVGTGAGLVVSSLLFGAAHGYQSRLGMTSATIAGLVLGAVYIASGSLLLVMLMHATYNMASFTAGMLLLEGSGGTGSATR